MIDQIEGSKTSPWSKHILSEYEAILDQGSLDMASSAYVVIFSLLARRKSRSLIGLFLGLALGTLARVGIMIPANLIITPIYANLPLSAVKGMILPIVIPFNLLHSGINSLLFVLMNLAIGKPLQAYLLRKGRD